MDPNDAVDPAGDHLLANGPETAFYQADQLIEKNQVPEALALLRRIIEKYPNYGRAHNHLGYLYETKFKDLKEAENHYKKSLVLSPEYVAAYLNFAVLLSTQERWDELEPHLQRSLDIPGINKSKIYNEFGIMYEVRGELNKALEHYKLAIQHAFSKESLKAFENSLNRVNEKKRLLN